MNCRVLVALLVCGVAYGTCENGCVSMSLGAARCVACDTAKGFVLTGDGYCSRSAVSGAAAYDSDGARLTCLPGWLEYGNGCRRFTKATDCTAFDRRGVCVRCVEGKYPKNGVCTAVVTAVGNCKLHSADDVCAECNSGYYLWRGKCAAKRPNCAAETGPTCVQCDYGFELTSTYTPTFFGSNVIAKSFVHWPSDPGYTADVGDFVCTQVVSNCGKFDPVTKSCVQCAPRFFLTAQKKCEPVDQPVPFCTRHTSASTCDRCDAGYYPASPTSCVKFFTDVANCLYYNSPTTCARCKKGFYLATPTSCLAAASSDPNCEVQATETTCQYCSPGFFLQGATCMLLPVVVQNCARQTLTSCQQCANGFFLSSNNCAFTAAVPNCARFGGASTCLGCLPDYFLSSPTACTQFDVVDNCEVYQSKRVCEFCKTNFFLAAGKCVPVTSAVLNCRFHATADTCQQCKTSFHLTADAKHCEKTLAQNCDVASDETTCLYCAAGFYYVVATNACVDSWLVSNCARYDSSQKCVRCFSGWALSSGTCLQSSQSGNCRSMVLNSSGREVCEVCNFPLILNKLTGKCDRMGQTPLLQCSVHGYDPTNASRIICLECFSNFYLASDGTCKPALVTTPDCDNFDASVNCLRCASEFYLTQLVCVSVGTAVNNCFSYTDATTCRDCKDGYFIAGNSCTPVKAGPTNCLYAGLNGACYLCNVGYFLNGATCTKVTSTVPGCTYYTSDGRCLECGAGMYVSDAGTCVVAGVSNCKYAAAGSCLVCSQGFFPSGGSCSPAGLGATCLESASATACATCDTSTYVSIGACTTRDVGVANCLFHASLTTCAVCASGFFLDGAKCSQAAAIPRCDVFASATTCATCAAGSALSPDAKTCVADCEVAAAQGCTQCAAGFFLSAGACTRAAQTVDKCAYYFVDGVCQYCQVGYLLDAAANKCTASPDAAGCRFARVNACAVCNPGFFNGFTPDSPTYADCTAVPTTLPDCLFYSLDGKFCEVCKSGFYQLVHHGRCLPGPKERDCYCYGGKSFFTSFE